MSAVLPISQPQYAFHGEQQVATTDHRVAQARLEEQVAAQNEANAATFASIDKRLTEVVVVIKEIDRKLSKQAGFMAGAMFIITGVMAAIGATGAMIVSYFRH